MNAEDTASLAGLEQAAHLYSLAERIHHAADDLPAPEPTHSLASISEEVEDQVRVIAGLFTLLASEAAFQSRAARRHPGPADSLAHRKIDLMTRAADPLGRALAKLGEAVVQIGLLHEINAAPRTPERAQAIHRTRGPRRPARRRPPAPTDAARNLHQNADLLVEPVPGTRRAPAPPTAGPLRPPAALPSPLPVSPAASRARH